MSDLLSVFLFFALSQFYFPFVYRIIQADKGFFDKYPRITHNLNGGPAEEAEVSGVISIDSRKKIELIQGNIIRERVDAIVNAANPGLDHAGGVAAAIRTAGGQAIVTESQNYIKKNGGEVPVGTVAVTSGGNLSAAHVIHAVGPRWNIDTPSDELLKRAVQSTMRAANGLSKKN